MVYLQITTTQNEPTEQKHQESSTSIPNIWKMTTVINHKTPNGHSSRKPLTLCSNTPKILIKPPVTTKRLLRGYIKVRFTFVKILRLRKITQRVHKTALSRQRCSIYICVMCTKATPPKGISVISYADDCNLYYILVKTQLNININGSELTKLSPVHALFQSTRRYQN